MLISLTATIIENGVLMTSASMYDRMSIPLLVDKIEQHLLLSEASALIVAFHRHHTRTLMQFIDI
jgi:hypothetical protein